MSDKYVSWTSRNGGKHKITGLPAVLIMLYVAGALLTFPYTLWQLFS